MGETTETVVVATSLGQIAGLSRRGLIRFRGIPFAEPPTGSRRFLTPVPRRAWDGILDATEHGPVAPQGPSRLVAAVGDFTRPQSEDCLTLSVTTTTVERGQRPVIVWLHGGGYSSGAGSLDWYDGSTLAREGDAVIVGVNYRLGPLGFLRVPGLSDGQAGLRDMIAAVQWVHDHIAQFGGDPDNVTLMGQSAGAQAIMCMLTMPTVRALFTRAILQSPPTGVTPYTSEQAASYTDRFFEILGYEDDDALIERIQAEPVNRLLAAAGELARASARIGKVAPPFFPVVEGFSNPQEFAITAADGAAAAGISILVGTNRDEARSMIVGDPTVARLERDRLDAYLASIFKPSKAEMYWRRRAAATPADILADAITDNAFVAPTLLFAETAAEQGAPVWTYQVDWAPSGSAFGACHCIELPLVFGTPAAWVNAPILHGADPTELTDLASLMRTSWLTFCRTGNPGHALPWPRYDTTHRSTMVFDSVSGPVNDPAGVDWRL